MSSTASSGAQAHPPSSSTPAAWTPIPSFTVRYARASLSMRYPSITVSATVVNWTLHVRYVSPWPSLIRSSIFAPSTADRQLGIDQRCVDHASRGVRCRLAPQHRGAQSQHDSAVVSHCQAVNIGASRVDYGAHGGDHVLYPDCRPAFVEAMNDVAQIANFEPVTVHAPYLPPAKPTSCVMGSPWAWITAIPGPATKPAARLRPVR